MPGIRRKSSKTKSLPSRPTNARKKKTSDRATYLGLGSNLGNRFAHLRLALREIGELAPVVRVSPFFETEPEGYAAQRPFVNAVAEVRTAMPAAELLRAVKRIERRGGRTRTFRNGPRTIDIDLLDVRGEVASSRELTLPHPRLHRRRFALEPLAAIAPRWRHPVSGKTARQLLKELEGLSPRSALKSAGRTATRSKPRARPVGETDRSGPSRRGGPAAK